MGSEVSFKPVSSLWKDGLFPFKQLQGSCKSEPHVLPDTLERRWLSGAAQALHAWVQSPAAAPGKHSFSHICCNPLWWTSGVMNRSIKGCLVESTEKDFGMTSWRAMASQSRLYWPRWITRQLRMFIDNVGLPIRLWGNGLPTSESKPLAGRKDQTSDLVAQPNVLLLSNVGFSLCSTFQRSLHYLPQTEVFCSAKMSMAAQLNCRTPSH